MSSEKPQHIIQTGCKPSKHCSVCRSGIKRYREIKNGVQTFIHLRWATKNSPGGIQRCECQDALEAELCPANPN